MAKTATRKRGRPPKKAAKKATKSPKVAAGPRSRPSSNGAAKTKSAGPGKFDPKQPPLPAMADVDPRIKDLDDECQKFLAAVDEATGAAEDQRVGLGKIGDLLKKHELDTYSINGRQFYIKPGSPQVKCRKLKQQD